MNEENILNRTRLILAGILELDPSKIPDDASSLNLSEWDSLHHMNVILGLENEFGIEFSDAEIQEIHSMKQLAVTIQKHLAD